MRVGINVQPSLDRETGVGNQTNPRAQVFTKLPNATGTLRYLLFAFKHEALRFTPCGHLTGKSDRARLMKSHGFPQAAHITTDHDEMNCNIIDMTTHVNSVITYVWWGLSPFCHKDPPDANGDVSGQYTDSSSGIRPPHDVTGFTTEIVQPSFDETPHPGWVELKPQQAEKLPYIEGARCTYQVYQQVYQAR